MNEILKRVYKRYGVKLTLYLVVALILVDTFLTYQYKQALVSNIEAQANLDEIAARKGTIISDLNNIDMSLRGYLLVGNEAFLDTYDKIKGQNRPTIVYLSQKLPEIGIDASNLSKIFCFSFYPFFQRSAKVSVPLFLTKLFLKFFIISLRFFEK